MTLEKAIEFGKIFLKTIEDEKGSATYEFVETAVKALEEGGRRMTKEEAIEILKNCELNPCVPEDKETLNMAIKALKNNNTTNFKDELKTLVVKRLDEINHLIAGCYSPFSYTQIRETQELMCDIRTTLGIEDAE